MYVSDIGRIRHRRTAAGYVTDYLVACIDTAVCKGYAACRNTAAVDGRRIRAVRKGRTRKSCQSRFQGLRKSSPVLIHIQVISGIKGNRIS